MPDTEIDRRCPKCACQRTTQLSLTMMFGATSENRVCDFCRHKFRVTRPKDKTMLAVKAAIFDHNPDGAVLYHSEAVRCACPYCHRSDPPIYCTKPAVDGVVVRHHKCTGCARTFKSEERQR